MVTGNGAEVRVTEVAGRAANEAPPTVRVVAQLLALLAAEDRGGGAATDTARSKSVRTGVTGMWVLKGRR